MGRFISEDPMGFGAGDTNLYRYVGNNSTNATDPTGMWELPSWNDITQPFQVAGQFWGGVIADGATNFRNTVTTNAQTGLEYWAGVAVQGQNEGNIWKQIAGTAGGLLSSLATEDNIDKTNETLAFAFGGGVIAAGGEALAGLKLTKTLATAIAATSWVKAATPFVKAATPWVDGAVRSGLAFAGGYQGGGQIRQAIIGEGEDGRQLSTAERLVIGATGVVTIASTFLGLKPTQCFVAGTEIQTLNGTKNIEDIHVGDWVLSDDPNTVGEIEYKQVLDTFVKETTNLVDVYIDGEKITTTEEHPFWVPNLGWVAAKDLHAGSLLQTKYESWLDVDRVERHGGLTTVYNFEVEGFHTYFVSDLGLLVHNTCVKSPTGHPVLAEVENITPGNSIIEASKPSMQGKLGEVHRYENPGHHDPSLRSPGRGDVKFNSGKSVLPDNHIDLFKQSVPFKNAKGEIVRYTRDEFGNIHRFNSSIDNHFHWTGSTNGTDIRGRKVPLEVLDEAQKFFKNK